MYESRRTVRGGLLQFKEGVAADLEIRKRPSSCIAKSECFFESKGSRIELDPLVKVGNADRNMIQLQRFACGLNSDDLNRQSEQKPRSKQSESTHESFSSVS